MGVQHNVVMISLFVVDSAHASTPRQAIASFTTRFWHWRAIHGPISTDDLPRTGEVRPDGWAPNVSYSAIHRVSLEYETWADELAAIRKLATFTAWSRDDQADYWALTSAVSRVFWEQHVCSKGLKPQTSYAVIRHASEPSV